MPKALRADQASGPPEAFIFLQSLGDALQKADYLSRRNVLFSAVRSISVGARATFMISFESVSNIVNYTLAALNLNHGDFKPLNQNFMIRLFEKDADRRQFLLSLNKYKSNPDQLIAAFNKMTSYEKATLQEKGFDAFVNLMITTRGEQETLHYLQDQLPAFVILTQMTMNLLAIGGVGVEQNGKNHPEACLPTTKDDNDVLLDPPYDQPELSPFIDAFIGVRRDGVSGPNPCDPPKPQEPNNPNSPKTTIEDEFQKIMKSYPDIVNPATPDAATPFEKWETENLGKRDYTTGKPIEKKELDLLRDRIRATYSDSKSGCREYYAKYTHSGCIPGLKTDQDP
jgi:hypothetical protein